tara:strand:+ start:772 stop:1227 length:456 start_codon:yes stop_codon:yes gene_type:complete
MEAIEELFDIKVKKNCGSYYIEFNYNKIDITDLRMLKFVEKTKQVINMLKKDEVKKIYFIFILNNLIIPANFNIIKDFVQIFHDNIDLMIEKVEFTIIQNETNLFKIFIEIFKKFYQPYKSLYLCKNDEETKLCLTDENFRKKIPNIKKIL